MAGVPDRAVLRSASRASENMSPRKGQNFYSVFGEGDRVFPLGGKASVLGDDRPLVAEYFHSRPSFVDHRLDREHMAFLDARGVPVVAKVKYVRLFVEAASDSVSAVVFDDAVPVLVRDILNHVADVRVVRVRKSAHADAFFHTKFRSGDKFAGALAHVSDEEHHRRVAVVAGEDRRDIYVHDVAVLEDCLRVRNAVADDFVDADAGLAGIAVVTEARGDSAVLFRVVADEISDFHGGDSGFAEFAGFVTRLGGEGSRVADELDFFRRLDLDVCHFLPSFLYAFASTSGR